LLIVNPNLCIDRTITLERLVPGNVHRTGTVVTSLGGKGINVARVARSFERPSPIIGFLPSKDGEQLTELAQREGADLVGISVEGNVRITSILLEKSGRVSVLNEPGATVTSPDWEFLLSRIEASANAHASVACSGSLPPGSPIDAYGMVVHVARRCGLFSVVDATGDVLAAALGASPDVVSPNLSEAEAVLFGRVGEVVEPSGPDVVARAGRAVVGLVERGARRAIVSAGSHGAAFNVGHEVLWVAAPTVNVANPIGAGDSLVGGLIHALELGRVWEDAVRFAITTASASCESLTAGAIDPARVDELMASASPTSVLCDYERSGRP